MQDVTFDDVLAAHRAVTAHLPETPAWSYPQLDEVAGCRVVVKHENTQPTGAFKVRGGLALIASVQPDLLAGGLAGASSGNHAQSLAFAAATIGVPAVVVVPRFTPEGKAHAVRLRGAEVIRHGEQMSDAIARARELATGRGMYYVDPADPWIVAGHASVYLELFRAHPDLQTVYVPVGSGSGAAGACLVRDELAPQCRIVGVQSSAAPAAQLSWRSGRIETAPCRTRHSGLATGAGFELPQRIMRSGLHDLRTVTDDQIDEAVRLMVFHAHTLAEGAGAAALAGLLADEERPPRCAVVCTGGNAQPGELDFLSG